MVPLKIYDVENDDFMNFLMNLNMSSCCRF